MSERSERAIECDSRLHLDPVTLRLPGIADADTGVAGGGRGGPARAAVVLDPPMVVARASGTLVVPDTMLHA